MKAVAVALGSVVLGATLLPVALAGGDAPTVPVCGIAAGPLDVVLATIRTLESGGDYTARASGSTASGAYQFINSTWGGYGGYPTAANAPPEVQDAMALELVAEILERHADDVTAIPVVWYIGHVPPVGSVEWDTVPSPTAGNRLTPRQYQARWLETYDRLLAGARGSATTALYSPIVAQPGGCLGADIEPLPGGWSLPGPRQLIEADPSVLDQPHHSYPAWDWIIPINTPIYAVRGGTVTNIRTWPHNWYEAGCSADTSGCDTCGIGLTITDEGGTRWTYCHGTNLTVVLGITVTAGQQIMWSGNTGRSGTPHLHLEIRTVDGQRRCPQDLLRSLLDRSMRASLEPGQLPSAACWRRRNG